MAACGPWTFYLGTHEVSWLTDGIGPLFVSHRRLALRASLPRAATRWARLRRVHRARAYRTVAG